MKVPVIVGKEYISFVSDLGVHGEGIGKIDGFTVFIPDALPEEIVKVKIILVKKSYAIGELLSIEKKSPYRVELEHTSAYGGCQLAHMTYEGQLQIKYRRVKDVITRIGGLSEEIVLPVLPAVHPWNYRNKMTAPVGSVHGETLIGYYKQGTHDIIPMDTCFIHQEGNNRLLRFVKRFMSKHSISAYNEKTKQGSVRHIMGRVGDGGKMMAVIITATEELPKKEYWIEAIQQEMPEVVSLYHNVQNKVGNVILGKTMHHIWGSPSITSSLRGLSFEVSPYSFFQVNKEQAEILYDKALECAELTGNEVVIDAYCGTGTISLCLARKAKKVIGIEIVKPAIEDAKKNAQKNKIENVEFIAEDAGTYMPKLYQQGLRPDVIVMDPVRAGCSEEVLKAAASMQPKRIVYVSCNPATFARDAKILKEQGYELTKVQPVDMFPQTMHVECVSLLTKVHK